MIAAAARRRLRRQQWLAGMVMLAAPLLASSLPSAGLPAWIGPVFFVAGLAAFFPSLPYFKAYKHALIATGQALGGDGEAQAWAHLVQAQRAGLAVAAAPALVAAAGLPLGLEPVAALLLTGASLTLWLLYRLPRLLQ